MVLFWMSSGVGVMLIYVGVPGVYGFMLCPVSLLRVMIGGSGSFLLCAWSAFSLARAFGVIPNRWCVRAVPGRWDLE